MNWEWIINKEDYGNRTPLFNACSSGNEALVKYLIEQGTDINKESKYGETPLFNANETLVVRYLIRK